VSSNESIRAAVVDEMVDTRRDLHAHPELGFEERRTTELITSRLASFGLLEGRAGTPTGAAYLLEGGRPGRSVILRADIDALPIDEQVDLDFRSTTDGRMHACGHDEHVASLLGVARTLAARAEDLPGRFLFVFQPAEEKLDGARTMIEGGVLGGFENARLVGHHVTSVLPAGYVAFRSGTAMSEAHSFMLTLEGAGGHGAMPSAQGDVVRAAAAAVGRLGNVVAGLTYEGTDCVCTAGVIRAGEALNVIPVRAVIEGTLRTFTDAQREDAIRRLEDLARSVGEEHGVTGRLELPSHTPAVVNDAAVSHVVGQAARSVLAEDRVLDLAPVAPSDDVGLFLQHVPGCYFFVGGALPDGSSGIHHSPTFAIDEAALTVAYDVTLAAALALAEPSSA
jgi:amidohydrolase